MELKDFVKTTLVELSQAIKEANSELDTGRKIKTTNTVLRSKSHGDYGLVDFDLAVTAAESKETGAKGGLRISVLEANAGKTMGQQSTSVSRIKFTLEADF